MLNGLDFNLLFADLARASTRPQREQLTDVTEGLDEPRLAVPKLLRHVLVIALASVASC